MSRASSTGSNSGFGSFGSTGGYNMYDDHNALGGGAGMFDFGMHHHVHSPLPLPPGNYEDFNPVDARSPVDYSALFSPPPTHINESGAPLLDNSEQSLFSSFLNTFSVDQNFLFNPVLPDGMPSPPPALESPKWQNEREQLAHRLDKVVTSPVHHGSNDGTVKPERSSPELFEDDEDEDEGEDEDEEGMDQKPRLTSGRGLQDDRKRNAKRQPDVRKKQKVDPDDEDYELPAQRTAGGSSARSKRGSGSRTTPRARAAAKAASPVDANANDDYDSGPGYGSSSNRKGAMTDSQKRSNHIASEQRRREIIRVGFRDLVDLITAGSTVSGISIMPTAEPGKKGKGRGRGRKGDPSGASKSTVLEKAREYLVWLEHGNEALEAEVRRVEQAAQGL